MPLYKHILTWITDPLTKPHLPGHRPVCLVITGDMEVLGPASLRKTVRERHVPGV